MDVYEMMKRMAKQNRTSITGIVRYLVTEIELERLKIDWKAVREEYPDTRGRVFKQWQAVDDSMNRLLEGMQSTSKILVPWIVKRAGKAGITEKQTKRWLQNQFEDKVMGRGTSPSQGEYVWFL